MNKLSPTIGFDIDRGDRATRMRELSVKLVEWGWEMAAPILFAFEKFMAGKPGDDVPKLEHVEGLPPGVIKIMTGELLQMIEHQKANAKHALEKSEKNRQSARKRWDAENANAQADNANAYPKNANATSIDKELDKEQVPVGERLVSLSIPDKSGTAAPHAGGPCVNAAPGDRVTVYSTYGDEQQPCEIECAELVKDPVGVMIEYLKPTTEERQRTQNTLAKRMREAGRETFVAVCWKFLKDAEAATAKVKDAEVKVKKYCDQHSTSWEEYMAAHPTSAEKWERLQNEADNFDAEGYAARTLFGRLKAYKPESTSKQGAGE